MTALDHAVYAFCGDLRMNEGVVFFLHGSYTLAGETVNKHTNKHCLVKSGMEHNANRKGARGIAKAGTYCLTGQHVIQ